MDTRVSALETILREHGYSITRQRLVVFNVLGDQEPMTMYELYDHLNGQLDRASLYRTISLFEELGIVQRINIGWKYKVELSDTFAEHHHHLACMRCGRVIPINQHELEGFVERIGREHDFQIVNHQVELQGYCINCKEIRDSASSYRDATN